MGHRPLCAGLLDEPRRQVEIAERHVPHAVGVQQRRRVLPEHRPEGARRRREAERAAGLGVHVRHDQRQVGHDQAKAVACMLKAIHARNSREACGRKTGEAEEELESMRLGAAARTVRDGFAEALAYTEFPPGHWPGSGRTTGSNASTVRSGGGRGSSGPSRTATRPSCW